MGFLRPDVVLQDGGRGHRHVPPPVQESPLHTERFIGLLGALDGVRRWIGPTVGSLTGSGAPRWGWTGDRQFG